MHIFSDVISSLGAFKQLKTALKSGEYPCLVTGVSGIHKAQMVLGLTSSISPVLVITDD